jgi:hypothetical protein
MTSLDEPAYTLVDPGLLKSCINSTHAKNTAFLITTHGEIISSQTAKSTGTTGLAMLYSGVPITVNYSDQSVNDQVLEILDKEKHFAAIQSITNIKGVNPELHAMATAMKARDKMHKSERNSSVDEQAKDSWRSHYFSQAFPFTKIPESVTDLAKLEHPNKRYTLRTFSDTTDDDDVAPVGLLLRHDDPKNAEVAHGNFEFKMNLFVPLPSGFDFTASIRKMSHVVEVTKSNAKDALSRIGPEVVFGQGAKHVLNPDLPDCILDNWTILLLPCGKYKGKELHSHVMLPYRFHTLSGINCVVFDLWHLLCYQKKDSYSQNGLSMTTTQDYMNLLNLLGIHTVIGVDLTCNVVGTQEGGWPSLTIEQLNSNHTFQEHYFEWVSARHSERLSEDYLPHLYACKIELNTCINFIEDHTVDQVLESLHPHIVLSHTVAYRGSSSFIESYRALSNFTKALLARKDDRHYLRLTTTPGHMETTRSTQPHDRLETNELTYQAIERLDKLIKHAYKENELTAHHIEPLQKALKTGGIRFDFTPDMKGHLDPESGDLTSKYKQISKHIADEEKTYGGVASKTYLSDKKEAARQHEKQIELQRADGTLFGGPGAKSKKPGGGGSRNKRRTRRHRLKKRMSKRSLTSRNNRRLRKRSHTRRRR